MTIAAPTSQPSGRLASFRAIFRQQYLAQAGLIGIGCFLLLALLAPLIAPQNPYDQMQLDIMNGLMPPMSEMMDGSIAWLGTDSLGRDILSAVLYGLRISLFVAVFAVAAGMTVGLLLGLLAALKGRALSRLVGSLRSKSAARLFPRYMPAVDQLHSTSSTQLHQAHLSCPNLHNFNLSFTKPEIPQMHMLCT